MTRPTFLSLFSGIGGLDLGLERAGWECVGQVENNPYCQRVLAKHWPDVPRWGDIREVDPNDLPRADLIAGGFPCQPFSTAGRRRGTADDRWLWPEFGRIIRALRPGYVFLENVPGLLAGHGGMGVILGDLAAGGYDAEWDCIPAAAVGAPHRRDRVWIVAYPEGAGRQARESHGLRTVTRPGVGPAARQGGPLPDPDRTGLEGRGVRGATRNGSGPGDLADSDRPAGRVTTAVFAGTRLAPLPRPGEAGSGRRDGLDHAWAAEPDVGRSLDGFSAWLDGSGQLAEAHKLYLAYANAEEVRPGEVLRDLRRAIDAEADGRPAGGSGNVSPSQVLLAFLRQLEAACRQAGEPLASAAASQGGMRGMRSDDEPARPPLRRQPGEQHPAEPSDAVRPLPQFLARAADKAWAAYRRSDAGAAGWGWEDGLARTAHGVPARLDRLRALGNAVVPQVAELIGRRILDAWQGAA